MCVCINIAKDLAHDMTNQVEVTLHKLSTTLPTEDVSPLLVLVMVEPGKKSSLSSGVNIALQRSHFADLLLKGAGHMGYDTRQDQHLREEKRRC